MLENINFILNIDLISVAITVAGIGVLGFTIFLSGERKNITNISFLIFALITIVWSVLNYAYYSVDSARLSFLLIKSVIFFGVWHAFSFYQLCLVFPKETYNFSKIHKTLLLPIISLISIVTLTPLALKRVTGTVEGTVTQIENGPGMALFSIAVSFLVVRGVYILFRKYQKAEKQEKKQLKIVTTGTILTFFLIGLFNIIFPAFLNRPDYIPLSAIFIFPFIAFTSYAILKHHLFNAKAIAVGTLIFFLSILSIIDLIFAETPFEYLLSGLGFFLILVFGLFLIKSVIREVKQREQIEILAVNLQKANKRLKELDTLKSEFVSIASHQLRSPLTAIKGYASLILEGTFGDTNKAVTEAIQKIFDSSKLMAVSVQDFLDVSRIEQGKMKYNFEKFELDKLVSTVVEELTPIANEKGLKLSLGITPNEKYTVQADMGKIKQVLYNLIDNSIKYTPKGSVDVVMCRIGDKINIEIRDTGVGVAKETIPKLFSKFVRSRNAHHVNVSGTGLGLFVVKQMVEAHKGRVWVTSEGKGKGSIFHVELSTFI